MAQLTPMGLVKILAQVTAIMVIPIMGGVVAGLILDRNLDTSPLLALSGLAGGTLIDGTGTPAVMADVGLRNGRVVEIGTITEPTRRRIDVSGRVVAPGFVDPHTHYDAQLMWDPAATPSSRPGALCHPSLR